MPPSILYHYTSQDGLLGIVTSKSIWASSIAHLNDAAEFTYAQQVLRNQAEAMKATVSGDDARGLDTFVYMATDFGPSEIFVCSFSENGDLLSQWRGYSPNGPGYSVGFDFEYLQSLTRYWDGGLFECIYDPDTQNRMVHELLTEALSIYREHRAESDMTVGQHLVNFAFKSFYPCFCQSKRAPLDDRKGSQ